MALVSAAAFAGCEIGSQRQAGPDAGPGDIDGGDGTDAGTPRVAASLDTITGTTELWTTGAVADNPATPDDPLPAAGNRFVVTLTSEGGFAGLVTPTVTGLGVGWLSAFDPPTVTLAAGGTAATTLRVTIPSNAAPAPAGQALSITATSTAGVETLAATLTVANTVTVPEVAPFPTLTIKVGTQLRFRNDGTVNHIIHGSGNPPHEDIGGGGHPPGGYYVPTLTAGTGSWYGHDFGVDPGGGQGNEVSLTVEP